jgi:hypothetical protein
MAQWKERRGVDATQERLGLAMMAYFHGSPLGLREAVALCGSERPLPAWVVSSLLRILDGLIDDVSVGRGHSTIGNRLSEFQKKLACWEAVRSARKSKLRGERALDTAATVLQAQNINLERGTIKKYHGEVDRLRRRKPGLFYSPPRDSAGTANR